ncbi:peptidoglycan recognition family protein [Streptosporangium sp. NPDC002544]|uniref:peptidoglycan recognition protein family protein n=1 Tax=Streptosporangium sp. NPDC002544 TaxID=3154538 RepID=UPI003333FC08
MKLVNRAAFGWGPSAASAARPREGLVIHYDGSNQGLASKAHSACVTYWQNTRKFHMGASRGWADIGYSFGACPHGYVFEGRGLDRVQAAQPGGNSSHYSVTLMSGPGEDPTAAQVDAVRQLRAWLMGQGVGPAVKGHRDFFATSCPGDRLYRLVRDGVFSGSPTKEDDMPTAKEIADAVYERLSHTVTEDVWAAKEGILAPGQKVDPRTALRQIWAYGKDGYHRQREVLARLDAQNATIRELAVALAARDDEIDVDALVARIEAAIEGITVRLEVSSPAAP